MRLREIIGEGGDAMAAAKAAQRLRDRQAKARQDIAAAASKKAEASRRYQMATRAADDRLKSSRRTADDAGEKRRRAADAYQQALAKANDSIARATRSLT
jgi:hypothetical protein